MIGIDMIASNQSFPTKGKLSITEPRGSSTPNNCLDHALDLFVCKRKAQEVGNGK